MVGVSQVKTIIFETGITTVQDFARLGRDLDWTRTRYLTRKALIDLPDRQAKVGQIEKTARKLSLLLEDDEAWAAKAISSALADINPDNATKVVRLIAAAAKNYNKPIKEPAWAPEASKGISAALGMNTLSALDWLVGVRLATVYERHFGQSAGRSRMKDGQVGGPYIRFVQATLRELGILNRDKPYSRETIARSVSTARGSIQRASKPSPKSSKRSPKSRKRPLKSSKRSPRPLKPSKRSPRPMKSSKRSPKSRKRPLKSSKRSRRPLKFSKRSRRRSDPARTTTRGRLEFFSETPQRQKRLAAG